MSKGRIGVPMVKFSNILQQTIASFERIAKDAGFSAAPNKWLASNFANDCVDYDCELAEDVTTEGVAKFQKGLEFLVAYDAANKDSEPFPIRDSTAKQFSLIGRYIDPDEVISFGIYNGSARPRWINFDRRVSSKIDAEIKDVVNYYGSVQGIIHSFHKESEKPHLKVRDAAFETLVPCYFSPEKYSQVAPLFQDREATIYVEGMISESISDETIIGLEAEGFRELQAATLEDVDKLFGCWPNARPIVRG